MPSAMDVAIARITEELEVIHGQHKQRIVACYMDQLAQKDAALAKLVEKFTNHIDENSELRATVNVQQQTIMYLEKRIADMQQAVQPFTYDAKRRRMLDSGPFACDAAPQVLRGFGGR
jgi:predicted RNase H-like nuclease (RuvC/YqgF family)